MTAHSDHVAASGQVHAALGTPLHGPWPHDCEHIYLGMGCFWGAEKLLWGLPGVYATRAGYLGGNVPHPTYEQVCTGTTGHAEVVHVVYRSSNPSALAAIFSAFWDYHDPTQGMRQGNDVGSQYRSLVVTTTPAQLALAQSTRQAMQTALTAAGYPAITTEIVEFDDAGPFYPAEAYHQQYLVHNPHGYCPHHGTRVTLRDAIVAMPGIDLLGASRVTP